MKTPRLAISLFFVLAFAAGPGFAQSTPDEADPNVDRPLVTSASSELHEAPGGAQLAQATVQQPEAVPRGQDPASQRSMSFDSGVGQCRDTVPGGPLLAVAYAIVLVALGAYVALLALKNAKLEASLNKLEVELQRHRPPEASDESVS